MLTLLDLEGYGYAEIDCEFEEAEEEGEDGLWIAPDAAAAAAALRSTEGTLAWALERRVEGVVLERSRGRF